tara:strand:+ start:378 stop:1172 length:795 start_codon:yes stop_codon:yes gene_type:complete
MQRLSNITPLNKKQISNSARIAQLTAEYSDSLAITSIAVTSTLIDLKDGDKFIIAGQSFTVSADTAATATSIPVDSVTPGKPLLIGDVIEIDTDNLFVQYQRKTEGTIGGMPVTTDGIGAMEYKGGVYYIDGVDPNYVKILPRDFMINDDGGGEALEFQDGTTNSGLKIVDSSQEMIATVNIPYGTTATHVAVWGSVTTRNVHVYPMDVSGNGLGSDIGSGQTDGVAFAITNTASTSTNYLLIKVTVTASSNRIFGGKVTLIQA